ncbi:MAG: c-type cytochrome [Candidatus Binatus sp.]
MEKWVVAAGLFLTVTLGWALRDNFDQEWPKYQRTYYHLALLRTHTAGQRAWARSQVVEIKQILPTQVGTVERCVTCHIAIDDPAFKDGQEPLRQHSALLRSHPPEKFGCVICHGGEGRAVTTLEAHGQVEGSSNPLIKGEYLQAACYNCHGSGTLPTQVTSAVIRGRQLVNRNLCMGCHQIEGAGGQEGPDLTAVGSQRSWLWLYAHLARPQSVVVGSTMPVFPFSRDQIKDITIYLLTLRGGSEQSPRTIAPMNNAGSNSTGLSGVAAEAGREMTGPGLVTYDGRELFDGAGCIMCHSIGRRGGQVGPELTYIGRKRNAKDLARLLRDPEEALPGGKMPQLNLTQQQTEALTAYLTTLR